MMQKSLVFPVNLNMKNGILINIALIAVIFAGILGCSLAGGDTANSNTTSNAVADSEPTPETEPVSAGAESRGAAAEALVADLYKQHDAKKSPFFQTKNRALVDKYFTKSTGDLIWKDATSSQGEVGALSADPLYDAQDTDIKNFKVGRADIKGDNATLPVNFTNFGEKKTITFNLKWVKDAWKIDDIKWPAAGSMVKLIREEYAAKKETGSNGEFQGKYHVGDTTCTVRPDKAAFEVKWAKGSGSEYFFYKGAIAFESEEDKSGGRNEFRFDDEDYNTGTFVRADGKTFPVSRAK